jgi:hypothetical protein
MFLKNKDRIRKVRCKTGGMGRHLAGERLPAWPQTRCQEMLKTQVAPERLLKTKDRPKNEQHAKRDFRDYLVGIRISGSGWEYYPWTLK